jgi:large subunit ribosomal protein L22
MQAKATARYLSTGNRKVGIVLELIRGKRVEEALQILRFTQKRTALMVEKVLRSALSNAHQKDAALQVEKMKVLSCTADQGPLRRNAKRFIPRAMGRASKIHKRSCHLTVVVGDGVTAGA